MSQERKKYQRKTESEKISALGVADLLSTIGAGLTTAGLAFKQLSGRVPQHEAAAAAAALALSAAAASQGGAQPKPAKRKRPPSAYNLFMKERLPGYKAAHPGVDHGAAFSAVAKLWSAEKASLAAGGASSSAASAAASEPAEKKPKVRIRCCCCCGSAGVTLSLCSAAADACPWACAEVKGKEQQVAEVCQKGREGAHSAEGGGPQAGREL